MKKYLLTFLFFVISLQGLKAQIISAGPDQNICVPNCATLTATITPVMETTTYTLSTVPYTPDPFNAGTALVWQSNSDDEVHGPINIGFNFCFMGTLKTTFYVGTNGWVGFANGPTAYTASAIPNPAATVPKEAIMGPWQDWYPNLSGGTIRYQVLGVAPFRRLVVSWDNCALYNCAALRGTFQIVLFETTNIVETRIQSKPGPCAWAGGTAVHGLHNFLGTIAFPVPGRNNTVWVTTNDARRWTPSGPPAYTFQWFQGVTPISSNLSVSVCPTTTTAYTAQITYSCDNSSYTDQVTVNVGSVPASAGSNASICLNNSTILNASGGTSYSWTPSASLSNATISNPVASPTTTTTYTVTVTAANGCTGTSTVTVTVLPLPAATANATNSSICPGGNTTLNASGGGTYSWAPAASLSNATINNPVASPTATTTYTVTVTGGNGCTATATVTVTLFTPPVATAAAATNPICSGGTTQLTGTGGTSYVWTPAASLSNSSISNPVASPTVTTTYTVTVTDANGCNGTATVMVTVNTATATATATNSSICPGGNTQLTGGGGVSYVWSPASSLSNSTISNPVASPTVTTTYTVVVTDINGCSSSTTITITVTPPANLSANATPAAFCMGGNSQLSASGGISYSWSPSASLSNATISNPVATPTTTTTYTVTITDASGCSGTVTVTVTVNAATATATATPGAICSGSNSNLSVTGNGTSFAWSPAASLSSSTISNPSASPTTTTTYTVIVTDANGCTASSTTTVTVNALPVVTVSASPASICLGANTQLTAGGGTSYSWTPSSTLNNSTISNPVATPAGTTTYTVTVTDANGCTATATVLVTVNTAFTLTAGTSTDQTCGSNDGTATAGTPNGGVAPYTYLWNNGQTTPMATGLTNGTYTVVITDANGCTSSQTVLVNQIIGVNAAASANPSSGSSPLPVTFTNSSTGGTNYSWNFGDGGPVDNSLNPSHTYTGPGTYTVMLIVYNGNPACADTVYLTVIVMDECGDNGSFFVPDAFSPNGDLANDKLFVRGDGISEILFQVFDRWGEKVFETTDYTLGWDGSFKGKSLDPGVFVYHLKITCSTGDVIIQKGNVTLFR